MTYETVLYATEGAVATITLNRPERLNAFNDALIRDLHAAVLRANADAAVRVVVLAGAGRGFSAGADLQELGGTPVKDLLEYQYKPLLLAIAHAPKPYISAVTGAAAGVGSSFAMVCDLTVMGDNAYILQAFMGIGLIPDGGATWHLARTLGRKRAYELMVGGERLPAARCLELGLVNRVVPADAVLASAQHWAAELARKAPLALAATKDSLRCALEQDLAATMSYEAALQQTLSTSEDASEGVRAFQEKRAPEFKGR